MEPSLQEEQALANRMITTVAFARYLVCSHRGSKKLRLKRALVAQLTGQPVSYMRCSHMSDRRRSDRGYSNFSKDIKTRIFFKKEIPLVLNIDST